MVIRMNENVLLNLVPRVFSLFDMAARSTPTLPKITEMSSDPSVEEAAEGLPERVLLWNETEAEEQEVKQVGTSACGATAVLNVLVRKSNFRFSIAFGAGSTGSFRFGWLRT